MHIKLVVGLEPKGFGAEEQAQEEAGATGADPCPAAWQIGPALLLLVNEIWEAVYVLETTRGAVQMVDLDCSWA